MKKTILTVLAAFALTAGIASVSANSTVQNTPSSTSSTGDTGDHSGRARLAQALGLTPRQISQIKTLRQNFQSQAEAIRDNVNLSDAQKKTQLKALRHQAKAQLQTILTPDQQAKLQQIRQARREARENGGNGAGQPQAQQ